MGADSGTCFTPCVEIDWRLAHHAWGRGFATEGARLALTYGFGTPGLDEIASFTAAGNRRSRAVMTRLGMIHDAADDLGHLRLPGHRPARHVLYRLRRQAG